MPRNSLRAEAPRKPLRRLRRFARLHEHYLVVSACRTFRPSLRYILSSRHAGWPPEAYEREQILLKSRLRALLKVEAVSTLAGWFYYRYLMGQIL